MNSFNWCKNYFLIFTVIVSFVPLSRTQPSSSAVTYTFSGGRFGDSLLAYCHAKWIAYTCNIPLLYKPFDYSDQLALHTLEIPYSKELEEQFEKVVTYSQMEGEIDPESGYLYVIPFFSESAFNINDAVFPFLFNVDWKDAGFKALLKKMIAPTTKIKSPFIPNGYLSVAVHVRKGTGWDIPNYKITPEQLTASHPLRFAPDSFFISQLKKIVRMYPNDRIYVYVFTDHDKPSDLAKKYQKEVNCDRMFFSYRTTQNNEFIHVLDDFFALTKFDCLIRADSNFSIVASKLGDYKVHVWPWHGTVQDQDTIIDEINFELNNKSFILKEIS